MRHKKPGSEKVRGAQVERREVWHFSVTCVSTVGFSLTVFG